MNELPAGEPVLVVINIPPALEEPLVDWLLERESGVGFTSYAVHGHSAQHGHLSVAEQVRGRQRRLQFEVDLEVPQLAQFLAGLTGKFGGTDLRYRVSAVITFAHLP
jgi:hypothetical protein